MSLVGTNINGYEVLDYINKGGFGTVYRAQKDGNIFAIKVFDENYVLREFRQHGDDNRIKREVDVMQRLSHKNLVKYIDNFELETEAGRTYVIVMEYVQGGNLREILNTSENGRLDEKDTLMIFRQILDGLDYLHSLEDEIIHRDLKPENILITSTGDVKIVDFGISKVIDFTSLTNTGDQIGTWLYMSPEQITDSKHIDRRSDLYTAGVIFYEMLTGYTPYDYQFFPELIDKIKSDTEYPIRPNSRDVTINNILENVILKLLEKKPYNRYTRAGEVNANLEMMTLVQKGKSYDITPRFILRLNNDKGLLEKYRERNPGFGYVEFPAHLATVKNYQGLLVDIQDSEVLQIIIDPSTNQLAYDGLGTKPSLKNLPYAPDNIAGSSFEIISPDFLKDSKILKKYTKECIDYQNGLKGDIFYAPFHHLSNSTTVSSTSSQNALFDWIDIDCKLARESIEYRNANLPDKHIYVGISLQEDVLRNDTVTKLILNKYSLLECDGFVIYVDKISNLTGATVLKKYIQFLQNLQISTGKPVIAGRVGTIGLGLLCLGITGFTSGASERDTFYEDLLRNNEEGGYGGMPVKYYFPQLLGSVTIPNKKDSTGVIPPPSVYTGVTTYLGKCNCFYCKDLEEPQIIVASNVKLHFLEIINSEIEKIKSIAPNERKSYFISRIDEAINYFEELKGRVGFKSTEFSYLYEWKEIFINL